MSDKNTVTVYIPHLEKSVDLPILNSTEGPNAIDVRKLYSETGLFTYDPGFMSTASCESKITFIDGEEGILRYRGYDISHLAETKDFLEIAYLLLYGELPLASEFIEFEKKIKRHTMVHEQMQFLLRGFPRHSHPMAIIVGAVGSLSAFYHNNFDINNKEHCDDAAIKLIAKVPTLAAMAYKYIIGQPFIYPDNSLNFSSNFLKMTFGVPTEEYLERPIISKILNKLFILHADHEQNASTSTIRMAGSSNANPFAVVGGAIASLWGSAHGGANEEVIKMLEEIGSVENIPNFIKKVKDKSSKVRLMGFGHRVYKNYDPRAFVLKKYCPEVFAELNIKEDKLLTIALELEKIALNDDYFIERNLYPNVDFYSGIIYRALGIPTCMFTVMFALARTTGWVSQWLEMLEDPIHKISRPRQIYTGHKYRKL